MGKEIRTETHHVKVQDPNDDCNCTVSLKGTNELNENILNSEHEDVQLIIPRVRDSATSRTLTSKADIQDVLLPSVDFCDKGTRKIEIRLGGCHVLRGISRKENAYRFTPKGQEAKEA
ncbi:hypothetical protein H920_01521 [Fukomys damarensis]|uniref:Uncharacterized protein n=1 Tax=Fukomys damarensis TaxID=885580 RepID=A0A091E3A4_FUKDA|nr:hypothetical protein H920_01521 [Fukomys damarensis]